MNRTMEVLIAKMSNKPSLYACALIIPFDKNHTKKIYLRRDKLVLATGVESRSWRDLGWYLIEKNTQKREKKKSEQNLL